MVVGAPAIGGGMALGALEQWGAIRVEAVQNGLQKFSEAMQVCMLVEVNFGDKGGLD